MKNEISYDATANLNRNIGRTDRYGLESYLGFQIVPGLRMTSEMTWMNARVTQNVTAPATVNKRIPMVPDFEAATRLTFTRGRFLAEAAHRFVGRRPVDFDDDNDKPFLPSFSVFDLALGFQARRNARIDLKVTNIFDREYVTRAIDSFDASFNPTVFFNPAPGIGFAGAVTVTF
jgi:outer membrane receptor protein involved in Fe transport